MTFPFRLAAAFACSAVANLLCGDVSMQAASEPAPRAGVCEREGGKLVGKKPVAARRSVRPPKKLRDVRPKYPELPTGTVGSGVWLGEVLIDESGRVARIWPIHEVEFTPPFPPFNGAITDAIRQWEFEPRLVRGEPMPWCMTVTVNINWQ